MDAEVKTKRYDLEDRTLLFAKRVRAFVKKLRKTIGNLEDSRQLVRSSQVFSVQFSRNVSKFWI
jgi:hypothetical protein